MNFKQDWPIFSFILFTILVVGFGGYFYYQLSLQYTELAISSTAQIKTLQNNLAISKNSNADLTNSLTAEKQRTDQLVGQVNGISSAVGALTKLSQTDKELLQRYSKIYFLNENYVPASLTTITPTYLFDEKKTEQIHSGTWPHLQAMLESASSAGLYLKIASAYRSFADQTKVKSQHTLVYGSGANKFSADQGYSEHQLGTAIDVTDKTGTLTTSFEKTKDYDWLVANAYKYGFVISYPKQNTYYQFEPWHWRFVGVKLTTTLHNENKFFYNFSQREILTYLANIFD